MIKGLKTCVNWAYDKLKYVALVLVIISVLVVSFVVKEKYEYEQCIKTGLQSYDCDFD